MEPPDALFYENQNVFVKSYLVSACSILEAFVQDIASEYMLNMQSRINSANLPHNFVAWVAGHEKANLEFKSFVGSKARKDISDMVSPSYWKTMKAFERIGIDISKPEVIAFKDYVVTTVEKRNKIVHHNDDASDLSFNDIIDVIDQFRAYIQCVFDAILADPHLGATTYAKI
ncbi:HEPN domain-containing protein [Paracoccus sp. S3-43]|uniref:HEPN domain-containing protein n=1 Tax=Paracoccus sp. S3-43 TaxID=3030011 RepID=UPI0023AF0011|nr:HEPN domain-containing protein [Paracoccus sp. S3-43]WEF24664.1 HEPN domain-containing protein [Paracoccus sp. S3-43]